MARPIHATISATGTYVFAVDDWVNPFNVAWQVEVPAGVTASYTLNQTLDPILDGPGNGYGVVQKASPTWAAVSGTTFPATATTGGTITSPIRALQLVVTALTGGNLTVNIIQPFSIN
ncbi:MULTISPECIES: hypothetical protein [unclassified Acidiphilium]|uniref:hypothetical protein n=1 Tax=unclassified Acidiphilium TaxID=2617493 RepID=UPI000BCDBE69|nr:MULTISPECIES: hypothetical protein [unclassified Acidiphilium]OYV54510.1 MAG: hypothetical protein B7Z76_14135 [Acidiphilium sp. 20-67-58]HQT62541.1 hypothetical protein [Acidiphilium sp.]